MENDVHRIAIAFETDESNKLDDIIRFVLGLQRMLDPNITMSLNVERSQILDTRDDAREKLRADEDDLPF